MRPRIEFTIRCHGAEALLERLTMNTGAFERFPECNSAILDKLQIVLFQAHIRALRALNLPFRMEDMAILCLVYNMHHVA